MKRLKQMVTLFTAVSLVLISGLFVLFGASIGVLFISTQIIMINGLLWLYYFNKVKSKYYLSLMIKGLSLIYVLFLISFVTVLSLIMSQLQADDSHVDIDYVIVLGAGLTGEGKLSLTLQQRVDRAYDYAVQHPHVPIILSGGVGIDAEISEAEAMGQYLIEKGIPPEQLIYENRATTTEENLRYSTELIPLENKAIKVLIITSDYHMYRALWISKKQGYETYGLAAHSPLFVKVNYLIREYFGLIKTMLNTMS